VYDYQIGEFALLSPGFPIHLCRTIPWGPSRFLNLTVSPLIKFLRIRSRINLPEDSREPKTFRCLKRLKCCVAIRENSLNLISSRYLADFLTGTFGEKSIHIVHMLPFLIS